MLNLEKNFKKLKKYSCESPLKNDLIFRFMASKLLAEEFLKKTILVLNSSKKINYIMTVVPEVLEKKNT